MDKGKVLVIIPAYNEAERILSTAVIAFSVIFRARMR